MKRGIGFAFLAATLLASASYPPYVKKNLYARHDVRGQQAPKIEVSKWLSDSRPDTHGKTVLIDMWATWCPPCRELIPELNKWSSKFKKDLVVVGISDEDADVVKQFMAKQPMKYNVGVDAQKRITEKIGVEGIPHVLVISPDGIVRWQGFPGSAEDPLTESKLAEIIKEGQRRKGE